LLLSLVKFPSSLHELDEVFVVVNRGADSGVVLVPLCSLNSAVAVSVTEVLKEFQEHFVFGHLARLHLGVHAAVVNASKVGGSDLTRAIGVELKEGLVDHSLSLGVEGSADADEELIEVDVTITVGVEEGHQGVGLSARNLDLDLAETRVELLGVDLAVSIERVEVSEGSSETSDGLGATGDELSSNSFEDYNMQGTKVRDIMMYVVFVGRELPGFFPTRGHLSSVTPDLN